MSPSIKDGGFSDVKACAGNMVELCRYVKQGKRFSRNLKDAFDVTSELLVTVEMSTYGAHLMSNKQRGQ